MSGRFHWSKVANSSPKAHTVSGSTTYKVLGLEQPGELKLQFMNEHSNIHTRVVGSSCMVTIQHRLLKTLYINVTPRH